MATESTIASRKAPVELTFQLGGSTTDRDGTMIFLEHDLTLVLPWYWQGITADQFRVICRSAFPPDYSPFPPDHPEEVCWFGDRLADLLAGRGYRPGAERTIGVAVLALHRHIVGVPKTELVAAGLDRDQIAAYHAAGRRAGNPVAKLRRYLHPRAKPLTSCDVQYAERAYDAN